LDLAGNARRALSGAASIMRISLVLLLFAIVLLLAGTVRADDPGNPYRYYRAPGYGSQRSDFSYGNPYRYYRSPSYYDRQPSPGVDYNEHRRQTLQFLYRHQLVPGGKSHEHFDGKSRDFRLPSERRYFYSSPYFYYRVPFYDGVKR
jgi:hypothetical protein